MPYKVQDSTNSYKQRKIGQLYAGSFTQSSISAIDPHPLWRQSLTVGVDIQNTGKECFIYGSGVRNTYWNSCIMSGVPSETASWLYRSRAIDAPVCIWFRGTNSNRPVRFLHTAGLIEPSNSTNMNWIGELLYIGGLPVTVYPVESSRNFYIGYSLLGLSYSAKEPDWKGFSFSETAGDYTLSRPIMVKSSGNISIRSAGSYWTNGGDTDLYMFGKLSVCDAFYTQSNFTNFATNSQSNENEISQRGDNVKIVGSNPSENQTNNLIQFERTFDQGRILGFQNSLVQGTGLNIDFYPQKISNSVVSGYRHPPLGTNVGYNDIWADDLYSEFNLYNCSHLGYSSSLPSGYSQPKVVSFTRTSAQIYKPLGFTVSEASITWRTYPFCGGSSNNT